MANPAPFWHHAMAIRSLELDQLLMLLVPDLVAVVVAAVAGTFSFPSEPNFVQNPLSIKSDFVALMIAPLPANPPPQTGILLVASWHHAMAVLSFGLDKLFMLHVPLLVLFRHGSHVVLVESGCYEFLDN
jgi:hypothetical protein